MFDFQTPKWFQDRGVAHRMQKRSLLIAVNLVAGLSIFFFGYDQGVMAGVNTSRNYVVDVMKIGIWDSSEGDVKITVPLKQGGIVGIDKNNLLKTHANAGFLERCLL